MYQSLGCNIHLISALSFTLSDSPRAVDVPLFVVLVLDLLIFSKI